MLRLTINGEPCEAPEGATILDALRSRKLDVPTLCHDERLHPTGACRLCVVAVKGWNHHATACITSLLDGMEIETHAPEIEAARRTLLRLQAARIYATSAPAMAFHGLGMSEHKQGTEGVMALVNLALLTGNFGKPGSGVNPLRGQNNVQGSAHMGCEPGHLTGFVPLEQGRDVFTAAWNTPLPVAAGLNLMEMIDAAGRCELKALWVIGYDVSFTNPDTIRTHEALGSVDLVVVQDLFFNELARKFGHVFLPAASPFEKDGTFMNSERRVQRIRRAVPAPGLALADWEIVCGVARAMGHGEAFPFHSAEEIWNEIRSVWKAGAGISYERIEHGGLQWPCPDESHPGTKILHVDSFHASATGLNHLTGQGRDAQAMTPEYKVVAVRLDRKGGENSDA